MKNNDSIKLAALESGKIDRRQLMQALGIAATGAFAVSAAPKAAAFAASSAQMGTASGPWAVSRDAFERNIVSGRSCTPPTPAYLQGG